jgi:hypothetical protein
LEKLKREQEKLRKLVDKNSKNSKPKTLH